MQTNLMGKLVSINFKRLDFFSGILNTKDPQYHDKVWAAQPNEKLVNGYTSLTGYQKMTHILTSLTGEKVLVNPERGWLYFAFDYVNLLERTILRVEVKDTCINFELGSGYHNMSSLYWRTRKGYSTESFPLREAWDWKYITSKAWHAHYADIKNPFKKKLSLK
ncbi:uncharacterized protein LOC113315179 isoform X1 [Papaver somniferum]|uniref:uncharacterized protein LOC113315179 isoform X1 n=1 Tax=Papaver somniferum TaxID=3469 RepID=UPI000E6F7AF8|nr:uncharacterized protein LOC113315179 isoform X1 [Papaver somniferum]